MRKPRFTMFASWFITSESPEVIAGRIDRLVAELSPLAGASGYEVRRSVDDVVVPWPAGDLAAGAAVVRACPFSGDPSNTGMGYSLHLTPVTADVRLTMNIHLGADPEPSGYVTNHMAFTLGPDERLTRDHAARVLETLVGVLDPAYMGADDLMVGYGFKAGRRRPYPGYDMYFGAWAAGRGIQGTEHVTVRAHGQGVWASVDRSLTPQETDKAAVAFLEANGLDEIPG